MDHQKKIRRRFKQISLYITTILIVLSLFISIIIMRMSLKRYILFISILPFSFILGVLSCTGETIQLPTTYKLSNRTILSLFIFQFFLIILSMLLYTLGKYYFLILIPLIMAMIFVQILTLPSKRFYRILLSFEIILTLFSFFVFQWGLYPYPVGIDPLVHREFVYTIVMENHIPSIFSDFQYYKMPSFHLLITLLIKILTLSYKQATSILSIIIMIIIFVIIYDISRIVYNDSRIQMYSAFFALTSPWAMHFTLILIPNTLGLVYAISIIYLVMLSFVNIKNIRPTSSKHHVMILIFVISLVSTHALTSFWLVFILLSFIIVGYSVCLLSQSQKKKKTVQNIILVFLLTTLVMLFWWTFVTQHIIYLGKIIKWIFFLRLNTLKNIAILPKNVQEFILSIPFWEYVIANISTLFYLFFGVFGISSRISLFVDILHFPKLNNSTKAEVLFLSSIGVTFIFLLFEQITGLGPISQRALYFLEILLSVYIPTGIVMLIRKINSKYLQMSLVFGIGVSLMLFTVNSPQVTFIKPLFHEITYVRYGITTSEATLAQFLISGPLESTDIVTDSYYSQFISTSIKPNSRREYAVIPLDWNLATKDYYQFQDNILVIRRYILKNTFKCLGTIYKLPYNPIQYLNERYDVSQIYASDAGVVFWVK